MVVLGRELCLARIREDEANLDSASAPLILGTASQWDNE
jgi:hypothetical protein